jgi:hypothetical protein
MRWFGLLILGLILSVSTGGTSAQFPLTPAYALVLTVDSSGQITLESIQPVNLRGELNSIQPEALAVLTERAAFDATLLSAQLTDSSGAVAFQTVVPALDFIRSETQPDPDNPGALTADGAPIDGHVIALETRTFSLRVPASRQATRLFLQTGQSRSSSMIDLDAALQTRAVRSVAPRAPVVLTGYNGGDPANRVDMVIMGDGYTAAEEADFLADAQATVDTLFSISPYSDYKHYFNVLAVFNPSNESGVDTVPYQNGCSSYPRLVGGVPAANPLCCPDPAANGQALSMKDTRYGGTFCAYGIHRLAVGLNSATLYQDANAAYADWDEIVLLLNTDEYGGSGGSVAAVTMHSSAGRILQHELGHSLMGLDDEYSDSANYPPCSDYGRDGITSSCRPNVTDQTNRSLLKWARWLLPSTPVPTVGPWPQPVPDALTVGSWLGAHYSTNTYYRSCHNCLMRDLSPGLPFGVVQSEQFATALYRGGWEADGSFYSNGEGGSGDGIEMIEHGTASPDPQLVVSVSADASANFSAQVLAPAGGALAEARWLVDGVLKDTQILPTGETVQFVFTPALPRTYTVTLEVRDRGTLLHSTRQSLSLTSQNWTVSAAGRTDGVELLSNGGFEDPDPLTANKALGWAETNLPKSKRICDDLRAASGSCSYLFKGSIGLTGKLQQVVTGTLGDANDSFLLRLMADTQNTAFKFTPTVKFIFVDQNVTKLKLSGISGDPDNLTGFFTAQEGLILSAARPAITKIKLMLKVANTGGKVLIDDVSLTRVSE